MDGGRNLLKSSRCKYNALTTDYILSSSCSSCSCSSCSCSSCFSSCSSSFVIIYVVFVVVDRYTLNKDTLASAATFLFFIFLLLQLENTRTTELSSAVAK